MRSWARPRKPSPSRPGLVGAAVHAAQQEHRHLVARHARRRTVAPAAAARADPVLEDLHDRRVEEVRWRHVRKIVEEGAGETGRLRVGIRQHHVGRTDGPAGRPGREGRGGEGSDRGGGPADGELRPGKESGALDGHERSARSRPGRGSQRRDRRGSKRAVSDLHGQRGTGPGHGAHGHVGGGVREHAADRERAVAEGRRRRVAIGSLVQKIRSADDGRCNPHHRASGRRGGQSRVEARPLPELQPVRAAGRRQQLDRPQPRTPTRSATGRTTRSPR